MGGSQHQGFRWRVAAAAFPRDWLVNYVLAGVGITLSFVGLPETVREQWVPLLVVAGVIAFIALIHEWQQRYVKEVGAQTGIPDFRAFLHSLSVAPLRAKIAYASSTVLFLVGTGVYAHRLYDAAHSTRPVTVQNSPRPRVAARPHHLPTHHATAQRPATVRRSAAPVAVAPPPQAPAPAPTVAQVTLEALEVSTPQTNPGGLQLVVSVAFRNGAVDGNTFHMGKIFVGPNNPAEDDALQAAARTVAASATPSPATPITPYGRHTFSFNSSTLPASEWDAFRAGRRSLYAVGAIVVRGSNGAVSRTPFCVVSHGEPNMQICTTPTSGAGVTRTAPRTVAQKPPAPTETPTPEAPPRPTISLHILSLEVTPTPVEGGTLLVTRVNLHNDGAGALVTNVDSSLLAAGVADPVAMARKASAAVTDLDRASHYNVPGHQDFAVNFNSVVVTPALFALYQNGSTPYYVDMRFYEKSARGYFQAQEICIFRFVATVGFNFCPVTE